DSVFLKLSATGTVMMGRQTVDQSQLFYLFNLEEHIPADHLLRRLNPIVTRVLVDLREKLAPFYSDIGRPSIDPELMIRMLVVGYCYGIRFERKLCEEVKLHLGYRWFCRLELDDKIPDHSTFSVNRHGRFRDSDILRQVFEAVVRACMDVGLVRGEGVAVDGRVIEADASRYHGKAPDEIDWSAPERQTRAVAEFLTALDDEGANADRKPAKVISPVDPCSAWTANANKRVQFGKPERLAADTAYGTGKFLDWVISTGITPHIPVWDMSKREEGILSRADFTFDRQRDLYICPQGKFLRTTGTVLDGRTILYRASTRDCGPCPLKFKCTPNMTFRKIPRDVHEDARDATRALMGTPEFAKSRNERKKVEMRFAHLKTHHGFERMRLRGLSGARDEFHLAAIVQNLKTLANHIWRPWLNMPATCVA